MKDDLTLINRILVLDDDHNIAREIALKFEGKFQVKAFFSTDYELAVKLPLLLNPSPELILLDKIWQDPETGISQELNGYELGKKIKDGAGAKSQNWLIQYYSTYQDIEEQANFLPASSIDITWKKSILKPESGEPDWDFIKANLMSKGYILLPV